MNWFDRVALLVLVVALASACGSAGTADAPAAVSTPAADIAELGAASSLYSPLMIRAAEKVRQVTPDSDEVFELLVANESQQEVPVVFVLEHADGQRWRTSLCVAEQCILGDGSDTSVTDPVVLSSLLEQPFQAHVFVDAGARAGQSTTLELRVEPQVAGMEPQHIRITAEVAGR